MRAAADVFAKIIVVVVLALVVQAFPAQAQDEPPPGPPPNGFGRPPGPPPGGGARTPVKLSAVRTVNGTTEKSSGQTYNSTATDVSAVLVLNGGNLTLLNPTVTTSGDTSSEENSSFHGQNAGVIATKGSRIMVVGGSITTSGRGANGLLATGVGAIAAMTGGTITATGDGGHGVMATAGGTVLLTNVTITTSRGRAGAVATDRGGGTITVVGGKITTHGTTSPGIYSTGNITASDATFTATDSEGAVIEGRNSITLNNCTMSGAVKCGVMIYQSFSGDAEGREGTFTMTGGALTAAIGPLFFVNNTRGLINLKGVKLSAASGVLVNASAARWGRSGSNGGHVVLTADNEMLTGNLIADNISSLSATLKNGSTLSGAVTNAALTLDATSHWHVTGDSTLTSLTSAGGLKNIHGHGHTVRYDASLPANSWLGKKTWALTDGGTLVP